MTLVRLRIDSTTFTKILTWQSTGHEQSFRTFAIRHQKSQEFQNTHLASISKVILKKWQFMVSYRMGAIWYLVNGLRQISTHVRKFYSIRFPISLWNLSAFCNNGVTFCCTNWRLLFGVKYFTVQRLFPATHTWCRFYHYRLSFATAYLRE